MIEKLMNYIKGKNENEVPEGLCPNCWGEQKYGDLIREKYKDQQIDVNNHTSNYAFIQKFVVTHLSGIKLKNTSKGMECPACVDKAA